MKPDMLTRAWIVLVALSGGSAAVSWLAGAGLDRRVIGAAILALALFKARLILSAYLGLARAPAWRRGFNLALSGFCLLALALYLIPGAH